MGGIIEMGSACYCGAAIRHVCNHAFYIYRIIRHSIALYITVASRLAAFVVRIQLVRRYSVYCNMQVSIITAPRHSPKNGKLKCETFQTDPTRTQRDWERRRVYLCCFVCKIRAPSSIVLLKLFIEFRGCLNKRQGTNKMIFVNELEMVRNGRELQTKLTSNSQMRSTNEWTELENISK